MALVKSRAMFLFQVQKMHHYQFLAATLLFDKPVIIKNLPKVRDIEYND